MNEWMSECSEWVVNEWINDLVNEWMNELVSVENECSELMNELMNTWV